MGRNCFRAEALTHICACNRILNVRTNSQILGLLPLGQNHNFFVCWFCFFYFMFGLDVMRIRKIINNNVVYSEEKGKPVILIGKGIGFAKKVGDHIPEQAIDQIFLPDSQVKFSSIINQLGNIQDTHYAIGQEVISEAKRSIGSKLNPSIFLTLTDHISFAIQRYNQKQLFSNPILWEIKQYYPQEFEVGKFAIALIKSQLGIEFDENEAGFIAMHIACSRYDYEYPDLIKSTALLDEIIEFVQSFFNRRIDVNAFHFQRFVVHLRFLITRIMKGDQWDNAPLEDEYGRVICDLYPNEYDCCKEISKIVQSQLNHVMTETELGYMTVHIHNMIIRSNPDKKENE